MPDMNSETLELILGVATGGVIALIATYLGFRKGVKTLGESIPGEDPFEKLDAKLAEKVDPIIDAIARGVDKLNPKTHGGAGEGPDVKPSA